jgi:hypothetical protein
VSQTQNSKSATLHSVTPLTRPLSACCKVQFANFFFAYWATNHCAISDMVSGSYQYSATAVSVTQHRNKSEQQKQELP